MHFTSASPLGLWGEKNVNSNSTVDPSLRTCSQAEGLLIDTASCGNLVSNELANQQKRFATAAGRKGVQYTLRDLTVGGVGDRVV